MEIFQEKIVQVLSPLSSLWKWFEDVRNAPSGEVLKYQWTSL